MAVLRPDVAYTILDLDDLKKHDPALPGAALRGVMERLAAGELAPVVHTRWPLAACRSVVRAMSSRTPGTTRVNPGK